MTTTAKPISAELLARLNAVIKEPSLESARALESALETAGFQAHVFGRHNQRASIEANAESDRGVAERLANAFDASLTAARVAMGQKSERSLTPRNAAQRYFCPDPNKSDWHPQPEKLESIHTPAVQFWEEDPRAKQRYRKFNPGDGLATVLVRDTGIGLHRDEMAKTILSLNTDAKLRTFEAIGQFGHGGSSSLFFCESALVMTKPRFDAGNDDVFWTLIYPEKDTDDSKQDLVRMWFADGDGLPLKVRQKDLIEPAAFPGTSVWHFGYHRGGWIKRIAGPSQSNPWGRLGRLFFSYPLPFEVQGDLARTDEGQYRTITSPFHRLLKEKAKGKVTYFVPEKRESLIVDGTAYGEFSVLAFVLPEPKDVTNYVESAHPIILTLNGQNHGEMTGTWLVRANLPELSSSMIVEVRLDGIEQEALSHIITNSRETPKSTVFTSALRERLVALLKDDDGLQQIERRRAEEKANKSNREFNKTLSDFLRRILSDAAGKPAPTGGDGGTGTRTGGATPLPEVPPNDPPTLLEFISAQPLKVPEGTTRLAKFRSDARPPKYAFSGDNPRLFASFESKGDRGNGIAIIGQAEINDRGYGSLSVHCPEIADPVEEMSNAGTLRLKLQSTTGVELTTSVEVMLTPKPQPKEKMQMPEVEVNIVFCAPGGDPDGSLSAVLGENVTGFGSYLEKYKNALPELLQQDYTYWGEKYDKEGMSVLNIEINVSNPALIKLLNDCASVQERTVAKQRYCEDIVLDCYQHCFKLHSVPDQVWEATQEHENEDRKASEMYLNHDKAIRFAAKERDRMRRSKAVDVVGA
jgi:hypothetical protein